MKKVVIIGGGFAGLAGLSGLLPYQEKAGLEITLISDKEKTSFLPMLPDCLGRRVEPEHLLFDLAAFGRKRRFSFIRDKAVAVDLTKKEVTTASGSTPGYDFLIISSGTETNFYGNDEIRGRSFKLDDADDAAAIHKALGEKEYDAYLVAGGGYTGVEVATNLRVYLNRRRINKRIVIIERAGSILGPLPQWMKDYVLDNLKKLDIEVELNSGVEKFSGCADPMLIWAAGVRTGGFIQGLKVEKNPQGRIRVDKYLRVNDSCFAAGDTAYFSHRDGFLRMAVQFALAEGECCAKNIIRGILGKSLLEYRPRDLGLIIPMANNRGCGRVLGINMQGYLPVFLHYLMCVYRSRGLKNRYGIIKDLMAGNGCF